MTEMLFRTNLPDWRETDRLAALRGFDILDTEPEQDFEDLAKMAARACRTSIAIVNFIDKDRQWFKAIVGSDVRQTSIEVAFCAHTILQPNLLIVPDTANDARFCCNPFVQGEPHLRFYAGATIKTDEGLPLGTICVLDSQPRPEGLTPDQAETLAALARSAMNLLKLRRAERLLTEQRNSFNTLADALPQMIWSARSDGCDEYTNKRWYEFTGAPAGASTDKGWIEMLHPDDRDQTWAQWQHAAETGQPYETACRLRHHSGEYRWILARALPVRDSRGLIERWLGTYTDIHDWKTAEAEAEKNRERYKALLEASAVVFWLAAPDGAITHLEGSIEFGGLAQEAYTGIGWLDFVHPEDRNRVIAAWQWALSSGTGYQNEFRIRLANGEYRWLLANAVPLKNPDETVREWVGSISDIHDRKEAEGKLRSSEERLRLALHAGRMFAWEQDLTTDYITRSQNAIALLGVGSGPLSEFLEKVHPEDRGLRVHFGRRVKAQGSYTSEFRFILPSGKVLWLGSRAELRSPDRVVGVTFDITDRKVAEEEIWRAANHDALTGLPNRVLFNRFLEQELTNARQNQISTSLLLVDLDDFKDVNDTLGHDAGDALLKETAQRLSALIGEHDTVARLGGDEFAIMLAAPASLEDATRFAERVVESLREPFTYRRQTVASRASVGAAAFPEHGSQSTELMKSADIALYRAKAQGRNRVLTYSPIMRREIEERVSLGNQVREALSRDQMAPFYQPKVSLSTGKIVGFEALARLKHSSQGILTPAFFGAAFQDPELAIGIRKQIIGKITADMRSWLDSNIDFGRVAMNLSSADFNQPTLVGDILDALATAGIPPEHFELEITETVLLGRSSDCVSAILNNLRGQGIRIALDDFGTGYASLMHLKQFPVDHVKIDRTFIKDLSHGSDDEAIVAAVIGLGKSLHLDITAEGVETQEQVTRLRELDCDYAQGFYYAASVPGERVLELLRGGMPRNVVEL